MSNLTRYQEVFLATLNGALSNGNTSLSMICTDRGARGGLNERWTT